MWKERELDGIGGMEKVGWLGWSREKDDCSCPALDKPERVG